VIAAPLISTDNAKQSLTIGLLPPLQFLNELHENSRIFIQSSASLPSHLPKYTSIKHLHFRRDCGADDIHRQQQTIPHNQTIAFPLIFELAQTHPIKHEPSITPPKIHINQTSHFRKWLRRLCHPPTTPNNPSTRLLPPLQFLQNLLKNSQRYIQSSASLPSRLSKYTSIKHLHFRSDYGASAIHQQYQTIPHHQAIAFTLIFVDITQELAQTHPIKHEPSLTPPKIHINQTLLPLISTDRSSMSLPSYLQIYKSIKHHHIRSDYSASAIHRQCQ